MCSGSVLYYMIPFRNTFMGELDNVCFVFVFFWGGGGLKSLVHLILLIEQASF